MYSQQRLPSVLWASSSLNCLFVSQCRSFQLHEVTLSSCWPQFFSKWNPVQKVEFCSCRALPLSSFSTITIAAFIYDPLEVSFSERGRYSHKFFSVYQFSQQHLWKMLSFLPFMVLAYWHIYQILNEKNFINMLILQFSRIGLCVWLCASTILFPLLWLCNISSSGMVTFPVFVFCPNCFGFEYLVFCGSVRNLG